MIKSKFGNFININVVKLCYDNFKCFWGFEGCRYLGRWFFGIKLNFVWKGKEV